MFKDRKEFEEALVKSVEADMAKAKFISPEQQKANKEKYKTLNNSKVTSELPKAPNEFNEKGVPNLHIQCMKDALEHFESPPSAHVAVKGHLLGRDLSEEEAHDIYEGPHSGFGSSLPDPEEIAHNESINPDLYNDNRVHEMLHSMEPEKIKSLAAKLHDWHSEKLEPGYYGEGDEDTLEDTKAHLNNLKAISNHKAKPNLSVVKTKKERDSMFKDRKEFEDALVKSVQEELNKTGIKTKLTPAESDEYEVQYGTNPVKRKNNLVESYTKKHMAPAFHAAVKHHAKAHGLNESKVKDHFSGVGYSEPDEDAVPFTKQHHNVHVMMGDQLANMSHKDKSKLK